MQAGPEGPSPLAERLLAGDKRALARARHRAAIAEAGDLAERRRRNLLNEVLALVTARLRAAVAAGMRDDPEVQELLDSVVARRLDPASAARAILTRRPAADLSVTDTNPQFADRL